MFDSYLDNCIDCVYNNNDNVNINHNDHKSHYKQGENKSENIDWN